MAPNELADISVGSKVEIWWPDDELWYPAKALRVWRGESGCEVPQALLHFDNERSNKHDCWMSILDHSIRSVTTEANRADRDFGGMLGRLRDDTFVAEEIVDERGEGKHVEFRVRWRHWSADDDTWEPRANIIDKSLIKAWHAKRKAAREAKERAQREAEEAARAAEEAAKAQRAAWAGDALAHVREKLLAKVRGARRSAPKGKIIVLERFAEWEMKALHELCTRLVPAGHDASEHVTELKQTVGAKGASTTVAYEFCVRSHFLAGALVDCESLDPERSQHVIYRTTGHGVAVALLPSLTFTRRGPRAAPHRARLVAKARWATLTARPDQRPVWTFPDDVPESHHAQHIGPIARRVDDIAQRSPGLVQDEMAAEAAEAMQ